MQFCSLVCTLASKICHIWAPVCVCLVGVYLYDRLKGALQEYWLSKVHLVTQKLPGLDKHFSYTVKKSITFISNSFLYLNFQDIVAQKYIGKRNWNVLHVRTSTIFKNLFSSVSKRMYKRKFHYLNSICTVFQ